MCIYIHILYIDTSTFTINSPSPSPAPPSTRSPWVRPPRPPRWRCRWCSPVQRPAPRWQQSRHGRCLDGVFRRLEEQGGRPGEGTTVMSSNSLYPPILPKILLKLPKFKRLLGLMSSKPAGNAYVIIAGFFWQPKKILSGSPAKVLKEATRCCSISWRLSLDVLLSHPTVWNLDPIASNEPGSLWTSYEKHS